MLRGSLWDALGILWDALGTALEIHMLTELLDLGAVDVGELSVQDWEALACWKELRPLQQRRVLQHTVGPQRAPLLP